MPATVHQPLRCPVWAMMLRSDAPPIAAAVAWPARSEWPAYFEGVESDRSRQFFYDTRHVERGKTMRLNLAMSMDRAKRAGMNLWMALSFTI